MPDDATTTEDIGSETRPPRVFISYTHDDEKHKERVLALAERLTNEGIDCHLDRYYETPPPAEGWPLWMEHQIERADFVLLVCTEMYLRRFRREEEQGRGLGGQWEGAAITQHLYNTAAHNPRFIPVGFEPYQQASKFIPLVLQSTNYYAVSSHEEYERLYRHLTGQPAVQRPPLGSIRSLPSRKPSNQQMSESSIPSVGVHPTSDLVPALSAAPMDTEWKPTELRDRMTSRLNRGEVAVLWFDLFANTLDSDLPGRSLPDCVIELISRAIKRGELNTLVSVLARLYPHVLTDPR